VKAEEIESLMFLFLIFCRGRRREGKADHSDTTKLKPGKREFEGQDKIVEWIILMMGRMLNDGSCWGCDG
jgi:hypothetical protein